MKASAMCVQLQRRHMRLACPAVVGGRQVGGLLLASKARAEVEKMGGHCERILAMYYAEEKK
jgi:hypothetical protein